MNIEFEKKIWRQIEFEIRIWLELVFVSFLQFLQGPP
jgi:hypothetical protein